MSFTSLRALGVAAREAGITQKTATGTYRVSLRLPEIEPRTPFKWHRFERNLRSRPFSRNIPIWTGLPAFKDPSIPNPYSPILSQIVSKYKPFPISMAFRSSDIIFNGRPINHFTAKLETEEIKSLMNELYEGLNPIVQEVRKSEGIEEINAPLPSGFGLPHEYLNIYNTAVTIEEAEKKIEEKSIQMGSEVLGVGIRYTQLGVPTGIASRQRPTGPSEGIHWTDPRHSIWEIFGFDGVPEEDVKVKMIGGGQQD